MKPSFPASCTLQRILIPERIKIDKYDEPEVGLTLPPADET
jgi:hypothetical protein